MKFQYNYINNQLSRIDPNNPKHFHLIAEEFTGNFGANGFILGENSWITFTVYERKIKVFAKIFQNDKFTYYRKELIPIPLNKLPLVIPNFAREITFEFTPTDQVIKNEKGYWVPKRESG